MICRGASNDEGVFKYCVEHRETLPTIRPVHIRRLEKEVTELLSTPLGNLTEKRPPAPSCDVQFAHHASRIQAECPSEVEEYDRIPPAGLA